MSYLSVTLKRLMEGRGWSQMELAGRTEIAQGQISRYLDDALPEQFQLERLCLAFEEEGVDLLVAWLRDHTPPRLRRLVDISVRGRGVSEEPPLAAVFSRLSPELQSLVERVALTCERNARMAMAIESTLSLAGPDTGS